MCLLPGGKRLTGAVVACLSEQKLSVVTVRNLRLPFDTEFHTRYKQSKMEHSPGSFADGRFSVQRSLKPHSSVYVAFDRETKTEVVIKLEVRDDPHPNLRFEHKLAAKLQGNIGVPRVVWFGESEGYTVLARELLGPSLQDLFWYCGRVLSLKTVLLLAEQILSRVELCHSRDYLHRNLLPRHFLIGTGSTAHQVHLIGLERCKRFRSAQTRKHIECREGRKLVADPRFASGNMLVGVEESRRDDLETVGYVFVYFLTGKLPWDVCNSPDQLVQCKLACSLPDLCHQVPSEFLTYLSYCKALKFEAKPDYSYVKRLFRDLFNREHYANDFIFDWNVYHYVNCTQNKHKDKQEGGKRAKLQLK